MPAFVPNLGQWHRDVRYRARFGGVTAFVEAAGWSLALSDPERRRGAAVRLHFAGAHPSEVAPEERLAGVHNYFLGSDAARWRTGVPRFGGVLFRDLYDGIDVRAHSRDGRFEYDVELAPRADLAAVEVEVSGAGGLRLAEGGELELDTELGPLRMTRPLTYEIDAAGRRREVPCDYVLLGENRFGFAAPGWSGERALVLDPTFYSTYLGGSDTDTAQAVKIDGRVITLAGWSSSADYPVSAGAFAGAPTQNDVVVTRLDASRPPAQQLLFSTFVGGRRSDVASALAIEAAGIITVVGSTDSDNFPTTANGFQRGLAGGHDGFVLRLDPAKTGAAQLSYATYFGGASYGFEESSEDDIAALSVTETGRIAVTGSTGSTQFPTTRGAFQLALGTTYVGNPDAFAAILDPALPPSEQLVYSTYFGVALAWDSGAGVHLDASGIVTLTGSTELGLGGFPVTANAFDPSYNGGDNDSFLAQLDPSKTGSEQLVYSTFLGGQSTDFATTLHVEGTVATVCGSTSSDDLPTSPGAFQTAFQGGGADAFVLRLDLSRTGSQQLVYGTYLGGEQNDTLTAAAVGPAGVTTVTGWTRSTMFPTTTGAARSNLAGQTDAFLAQIDPSRTGARQVVYSTYFGGTGNDTPQALDLDAHAGAVIVGETDSTDYATSNNAWSRAFGGGFWDAFVTYLDLLPRGAGVAGRSSPGCEGPLAMGVTSMPQIGNSSFAITCTAAPPSGNGALLLGTAGLGSPLAILGVGIWVDPTAPGFTAVPVQSTSRGTAELALPIPGLHQLANARLFSQFVWIGPSAPPPCPPLGLSSSNRLEIVIQP